MIKSILKNRKSLAKQFAKVDVNDIQDEALKAKFRNLKGKQRGFTLLELLVVVSILAAIAGTATLALQDTDARAAAAAHVAMMDELNKGIRTFKALNKSFPNNFDSLMQVTDAEIDVANGLGAAGTASLLTGELLAIEDVQLKPLSTGVLSAMEEVGLTGVRVVINNVAPTAGNPDDSAGLNCGDVQELIGGRTNAVVAGNIFMSPGVNGCGAEHALQFGDQLAFWDGGSERITGRAEAGNFDDNGNTAFLALGVGPASDLFDTTKLAGMTSVPVYRHVSADQYNRFVAIYSVGTFDNTISECVAPAITGATSAVQAQVNALYLELDSSACDGTTPTLVIDNLDVDEAGTLVAITTGTLGGTTATEQTQAGSYDPTAFKRPEQVQLVTVVDGAGDTKEEELGEWDGSRNTI